MGKKQNKKKNSDSDYLQKLLDSDDELPTEYFDSPFVPAYKVDNRFGFIEEKKVDKGQNKEKKVDKKQNEEEKVDKEQNTEKKVDKEQNTEKKVDKEQNKEKKVCKYKKENKKVVKEQNEEKKVDKEHFFTKIVYMEQNKVKNKEQSVKEQKCNFRGSSKRGRFSKPETVGTCGHIITNNTLCFKCLEHNTGKETQEWLYNFLIKKDIHASYTFLKTCLVPRWC